MQTAFITGASGNLGQSLVKKFLEEGYRVIGTVMANDPVPIDIEHDNFEKVTLNLLDEEATAVCINNLINKYDFIDVAVLTIGGFAMGNIAETTSGEISKQFSLNFLSAYHAARPLFTKMLEVQKGRIFLIGSKPGLHSFYGKGMTAYGLAKSLLFRLAELMNLEAAGTNIVVSVVIPSTIDTPQNRKAMPQADFSKWVSAESISSIIHYHTKPASAVIRNEIIKIYGES